MAVDLEEVTRFFEEDWELPLLCGWDWVRRDSRTFTTKIGQRTVALSRYGEMSKYYTFKIDSYSPYYMPYEYGEVCLQGIIKGLFYVEDHSDLEPEELIRGLRVWERPSSLGGS
jgi:hypothetical protein